jgi:hypothetical protein
MIRLFKDGKLFYKNRFQDLDFLIDDDGRIVIADAIELDDNDVDEVIEALNNYNANDHQNAVRYEELMKMPLAIIGGKGVWRNFKQEAKNDKITRYNIADEILYLIIETGGNIHDIVKTINEKYQLDLNEDKYYKE